VFNQTAPGFHQPLLQAGERPVGDRCRQRQSPPQIAQIVGNYAQPQPHLIAVADAAGGQWPSRARAAAIALSGSRQEEGIAVAVLAPLRTLFAARNTGRLGSRGIAKALAADATGRWCEANRGKPLTDAQLARLLRPFEIYPTSFGNLRGYRLADCQDAFGRYLLPDR
jgi:hypothetical protein